MPPFTFSVRHAVSAFRRARSHSKQLNAASQELAALGAILLTLGNVCHHHHLFSFTTYTWPVFALSNIARHQKRYNLTGVDASLPGPDAEAMFVQVRDFALEMQPLLSHTRCDIRVLWKLSSWLPLCWTGACLVPREKATALVGKWTDVAAREQELEEWLGFAAALIACAEHMVRNVSVGRAGNGCTGGGGA